MDQNTRKRDETPAAPGDRRPRCAAVGVYSTRHRMASAGRPVSIPALDWPEWTDQVRYTVTRTWPDSRPGGDA